MEPSRAAKIASGFPEINFNFLFDLLQEYEVANHVLQPHQFLLNLLHNCLGQQLSCSNHESVPWLCISNLYYWRWKSAYLCDRPNTPVHYFCIHLPTTNPSLLIIRVCLYFQRDCFCKGVCCISLSRKSTGQHVSFHES